MDKGTFLLTYPLLCIFLLAHLKFSIAMQNIKMDSIPIYGKAVNKIPITDRLSNGEENRNNPAKYSDPSLAVHSHQLQIIKFQSEAIYSVRNKLKYYCDYSHNKITLKFDATETYN